MKTIKEYINESLFDNEDDLLDKHPDNAIYKWLEENTKLKFLLEKKIIFVENGVVYSKAANSSALVFHQNPPEWIKFDEKSWNEQNIEIDYDIKSQKDIDNIPGMINQTRNNIIKDVDINTCNIYFVKSKSLENVKLHYDEDDSIHVTLSLMEPTEKTLMNISSEDNTIWIDLRQTKLCDKFKRQIKKYGTTDFYNKNWALFKTLYENKIRMIQIGLWNNINIYEDYVTCD